MSVVSCVVNLGDGQNSRPIPKSDLRLAGGCFTVVRLWKAKFHGMDQQHCLLYTSDAADELD
eukprot:823988-Ditylum_brightwellii.AAC.2